LHIPRPSIVVGVNENYYGMYVPSLKTIFITSLTNEFNIEWILSHETIHHVLEHRISHDASVKFDNVDFDVWVFLHNHLDGTSQKSFKNDSILKRVWTILALFLAKFPSALVFKRD